MANRSRAPFAFSESPALLGPGSSLRTIFPNKKRFGYCRYSGTDNRANAAFFWGTAHRHCIASAVCGRAWGSFGPPRVAKPQ
ncbi:hypothetical protein C0Z20_13795 [Trinickia symbiotica]|uniref:Uncharacterized protein n=1 Tax=Trinickia symbiotica TaxID=863227 RepID=A0A2N7X4I4_9BURK|nr:hypothetical protein C0Z20_13795 [Trinickia symbiotica]